VQLDKRKGEYMSKPKHTPGPWSTCIHTGNIDFLQAKTIEDVDGMVHAILMGGKKTQEANAQLIAAAPDMLVALELALEDLRRCKIHFGQSRDFGTSELALGMIEQAIAKAKGDS
jgi:hypothetical protein